MNWDCGWGSCDSPGEAETGGEDVKKDVIEEDSLGGDSGVEVTPGIGTAGVGTGNCEVLPVGEVAGMSAAGLTSSGASGSISVVLDWLITVGSRATQPEEWAVYGIVTVLLTNPTLDRCGAVPVGVS